MYRGQVSNLFLVEKLYCTTTIDILSFTLLSLYGHAESGSEAAYSVGAILA